MVFLREPVQRMISFYWCVPTAEYPNVPAHRAIAEYYPEYPGIAVWVLMRTCVCVRARACVRACVSKCVSACARVHARTCVRA